MSADSVFHLIAHLTLFSPFSFLLSPSSVFLALLSSYTTRSTRGAAPLALVLHTHGSEALRGEEQSSNAPILQLRTYLRTYLLFTNFIDCIHIHFYVGRI